MVDLDRAVTVVVSRRVTPGNEEAFERMSVQLTQCAAEFAGYLGATMLKPASAIDPEYRIIFRFKDQDDLEKWNQSDARQRLIAQIQPLILEQSRTESLDGIATWFSLPVAPTAPAPNRLRMTLVSWLALYPTVTLIFALLADLLAPLPLPVRTLIITGIVMFAMSYLLMPRFTSWFRPWIFQSRGLR